MVPKIVPRTKTLQIEGIISKVTTEILKEVIIKKSKEIRMHKQWEEFKNITIDVSHKTLDVIAPPRKNTKK